MFNDIEQEYPELSDLKEVASLLKRYLPMLDSALSSAMAGSGLLKDCKKVLGYFSKGQTTISNYIEGQEKEALTPDWRNWNGINNAKPKTLRRFALEMDEEMESLESQMTIIKQKRSEIDFQLRRQKQLEQAS